MFFIDIPAGSTLDGLVTELAPRLHAELVPNHLPPEPTVVGFHYTNGGASYTVALDGASMKVTKGAPQACALWVAVKKSVAEAFLLDWTTTKRLLPTFAPPSDVKLFSDPRVLSRLKRVSGRVELALTDFPKERASLTIAAGSAAKKGVILDEPDVVVETTMRTYERMLSGALGPEEALVDGDVKLTGKRMVAMQFALAVSALYPKPGAIPGAKT